MIGKQIKEVAQKAWYILRKPTTPVHVVFGLVCAFLCYAFGFWLGGILMVAFAVWELWNDWELLRRNKIYREFGGTPAYDEHNREVALPQNSTLPMTAYMYFYVPEGAMDFWESTIGFIIGLVVLGVLQAYHIIFITFLSGVM